MFIKIKSLKTGIVILEKELIFENNVFVIGRSADCDAVINDNRVSRKHARLLYINDNLFVEDTNSALGVILNGNKISEMTALESRDVLLISDNEITFSDGDASVKPSVENISFEDINIPQENYEVKIEKAVAEKPRRNVEVYNFLDEFRDATVLYEEHIMLLKQKIHTDILEKLNLASNSSSAANDIELDKVQQTLDQVLRERNHELPHHIPYELFRQAVLDELVGYGPITPLLRSNKISEIMINGPDVIFVESSGKLYESGVRFFNNKHLVSILQRIVEPLGRHVDDASPMVDARLPDGSRVNAVVPPLALDGASLTIRKFSDTKLSTDDLIKFGSMTKEMALFLEEAVRSRQNVLVSGGTGSGKTTLLNVLSQFIPEGERVITIEDSAELKLSHKNLVRLEARPANIEGKGRISIRDLVVNTLRMRPDRIIVGECRGAEALDMLQAMNTGHDGSLTTCHANNPRDALTRLENMVMMAGYDLPSSAIREQISSAIHLIVQQTRLSDGSRKVIKISEVTGREGNVILLQDIFSFEQSDVSATGKVHGVHTATGNIPYFVDELRKSGSLSLDMSVFVPKT